jgi:7-carboxy-7-deazaguanine synthase
MTRDVTNSLRISEIFYSIQGESTRVGLPTVFIRLTGCPLRCQYCDTTYAFKGGQVYDIDAIISNTIELFPDNNYSTKYITITGGEPLAQKACNKLMTKLCDLGFDLSIETSGAFDIKDVDQRVMVVMDLKTPASKESDKNIWSNLDYLKPNDEIKFVICDQQDYDWAKDITLTKKLHKICNVLFSPSYYELPIEQLADNILHDNLPVRLQTQLHKQIWGEQQGK